MTFRFIGLLALSGLLFATFARHAEAVADERQDVVEALLEALDDPYRDVRLLAAELLAQRCPEGRVAERLAAVAADPVESWRTRLVALSGLRCAAGEAAVQRRLFALAVDVHADVRVQAAATQVLWDHDEGRTLDRLAAGLSHPGAPRPATWATEG